MAEIKSMTVSWSALRRYEECKARQGLHMAGHAQKINGRVFLPGTVADRCMRYWLELDDPQPGQMESYVEAFLSQHSDAGSEYTIKWKGDPRTDRANIIKNVTEALRVLEPILQRNVLPYRYEPEKKFRVPIGVPAPDGKMHIVYLIGGMDILVLDDNDDFEVIDLKMTKDTGYARKMLGQLIFYSVAIETIFGRPDQPKRGAFYVPASTTPIVPVVVSPADKLEMKSRIVAYCQGVWSGQFDPNPDDEFCYGCECKAACPKFALPNEADEQGKRRASFTEFASRKRELRQRAQAVRNTTTEETHA